MRTQHTTPARLAVAIAVLLLGAIALGQAPVAGPAAPVEAADLSAAAVKHERTAWPAGELRAGIVLPAGIPGVVPAGGEQVQAEQGFESSGAELLSWRCRRLQAVAATPSLLQLEVLVASSVPAAQVALLAWVARTTSLRGVAEAAQWTRSPQDTAAAAAAATVGDVRLGLVAGKQLAAIGFVRGNVVVRICGSGEGIAQVAAVAAAVDALILDGPAPGRSGLAAPARAADAASVSGISMSTPVVWRAEVPMVVERTGEGELQLDFAVTGGMVTETVGGHAYYAGDAGRHEIRVRAMDGFGFPSSAVLAFEVVGEE